MDIVKLVIVLFPFLLMNELSIFNLLIDLYFKIKFELLYIMTTVQQNY